MMLKKMIKLKKMNKMIMRTISDNKKILKQAASPSLLRTTLLLLLMLCSSSVFAGDITSLSSITDDPSGNYVITADIDASSFTSIPSFSGTLEAAIDPTTHMPYRIKNLSAPLFTTLTGTVKNLVLENVNITSGTDIGAIACNVTGTSTNKAVIYNCGILSGSISGTGNVGGLVGVLGSTSENDNCYARVINCYSFADINGGTIKGGIVGKNCFASTTGNIRTMVMNCMFYGNIDYESGSVYPIYGGSEISNESSSKLNNYNYFLYEAGFSEGQHITAYNRALAAEERYLVRFEFYRYLINSTRELASWYVFGSVQSDAHAKMLKWVLDKSIAPYPILKQQDFYPSVVNYDPDNTFDSKTGNNVTRISITERNKGKNLGSLKVNISIGTGYPQEAAIKEGKSQIELKRTDKDYDDFNFNYDKVQLPYYNEVGTGNCTYNKVVTGWKITSITTSGEGAATQGSFTKQNTWDGYNFADRSTYAKDLYSQSGQVFSQGAYFDVPNGVTAISIEPYWGTAAYLADANYDCWGYETSAGVSDFGTHYTDGQSYNICGSSQKVYTSFSNALSQVSGSTVYDNAIVLVGNYHQKSKPSDGNKAFTIMSADLDNDNEPDYSFIYNSGKGEKISSIRFDFVNVPATSMAHKITSTTYMGIMGNHKWKGWLEVTNTAFIRFSQLEYDDKDTKGANSPVILLGGVVEQMVSTNGANKSLTSTPYIHVGSNVWFKMFNNGCHIDKTSVATPRIPISVTGGDYEKFYLSGFFQPNAPTNSDNAECYISGGRFIELAGAGQEKIDGNVQWLIDRADITNFYGGGINDKKPITGNITVNIKNSHVDVFCGGPKFGNMATNKTIINTATGCTFGTYFGAGYGGTSLVRKNTFNQYQTLDYAWNSSIATTFSTGDNKRGKYDSSLGIAINYEYENFEGSNDKTVGRFYVNYASLSLAQTNNVTSTLTSCTINKNFYGGGSLGKVNGNITSTLTNCTVHGSAFGAGFSATVPTADVFPAQVFNPAPHYNDKTGVFEKGGYPTAVKYTWSNTKGGNTNTTSLVDDAEGNWIHTDVSLSDLGTVTGDVELTINGSTNIEGKIFNDDGTVNNSKIGGVFGGGAQSAVSGNTLVNLRGNAQVLGNVFGGGDQGNVDGSTIVIIE